MNRETATAHKMPAKPSYELLTAEELADRWNLPVSWIYSHSQPRTPKAERIPSVMFGRWRRYEWQSPALEEWLQQHRTR